ncbi:MAG: glycosyltransferase family 4 protein [Sphingobacteriaceae bacterium]
MNNRILLLTLHTFQITGGIQKMCRVLAYTLQNISKKHRYPFQMWSMYDRPQDLMPRYLDSGSFRGFSGNRINFTLGAIREGCRSRQVFISHINLAFIGLAIKVICPKTRVYLIAHGIEVWREVGYIKRHFLKRCDQVICVSEFTRQQMITNHQVTKNRTRVLNNGLDPFLELPDTFDKPETLLKRYGLTKNHQLLFTLTRLASSEKYKGYEQVFEVLHRLKDQFPAIRYILSGQYDLEEGIRIKALLKKYDVEGQVILTGFIDEEELIDHFLLSDIFVLPSKKEGFGIVFIEALSCGLPVIGGNMDGSTDALLNGELGTLIDPDDRDALEKAIVDYFFADISAQQRKELQSKCVSHFGPEAYREAVEKILGPDGNTP